MLVAAIPLRLRPLLRDPARAIGIVDLDFLTTDIPITSRRAGPGMGPAIVGTLLITCAATLMAVPLGILAAVYINEYGAGHEAGRRHPLPQPT